MGTLTLAELRTEVKDGLANRSEFASDNTSIDRWLNQAQVRIVRKSRFKELNTLESKTATFADVLATDKFLPFSSLTNSNPRAILSLRVRDGSNSQKLVYIPFRLWDRRIPFPDSSSTGRPSHYTVYQKKIEFWKIPNQSYVYDIRLSLWATPLSAEGTASELDEKDDALIAMAKYYGFMRFKNSDGAALAIAEYKDVMGDAVLEDDDNPDFDAVEPHRGGSGTSADYWADPFQRTMP